MQGDPCYLSIRSLNKLFRTKALSPVELTKTIFSRIAKYNDVINAFCVLDEKSALEAARTSESRWLRGQSYGPLDGIPTSVKDLAITVGWPTRRGSLAIPVEGRWNEDSPSVARIREQGAVLIGKTTVPEFGVGVGHSKLSGITRNPWNPYMTPGGSSAGAAASLAAGMGTVALASDAGGSIRTPCAFSGVFGLKTSFGLVPDYPPSYLGTVAVIGPMARCVEDCALALNCISQFDPRDPYAVPSVGTDFVASLDAGIEGRRIAYSPTLGYAKVNPEVASIVGSAVRVFEGLGATVHEVDRIFPDPAQAVSVVMAAGLANAFEQFSFSQEQESLVGSTVRDIVAYGRQLKAVQYLSAQRERERLGIVMQKFHEEYDLLITPTAPIPAFDAGVDGPADPIYGRPSDWKPFTSAFNLTMQPAASVPCGLTVDGLPVGMQIVGPRFADALVLQACRAFEAECPIRMPDMATVQRFVSRDAISIKE